MTDPASLVAQAFAGSDLVRLAWMSALASLFVTSRLRPWQAALIVLAIDRALPFLAMAQAYEPRVVVAALFGALAEAPRDLPALLLRYAGTLGVVFALYRARLALHGRRPVTKAEAAAAG